MGKIKLIEAVLAVVSAVVATVKAVVKFVACVMKSKPEEKAEEACAA